MLDIRCTSLYDRVMRYNITLINIAMFSSLSAVEDTIGTAPSSYDTAVAKKWCFELPLGTFQEENFQVALQIRGTSQKHGEQ